VESGGRGGVGVFILDLLENSLILFNAHGHQLFAPIILIKNITRLLLQLLHMRTNQHLPQLDKVAVLLIIDLDDAPGVLTRTDDPAVLGLDGGVGADDGKGDFRHDFAVFRDCFVVVEFVAGGFEDLDLVVFDVGQDLRKLGIVRWRDCGCTLFLKAMTSSSVRVSALAMTGIKLT
jgi:hypothetical protein